MTLVGLEPVILVEEPNRGRTIIEKFEANVDVAFAVVVMTPDDLGAELRALEAATSDGVPLEGLQSRARQNVILELCYFIGLLGREHWSPSLPVKWSVQAMLTACSMYRRAGLRGGVAP